MSLCIICSTCLTCDGDILCQKHHSEFLKKKAAVQNNAQKPPFGLDEAAFDEKTFAKIGRVIYLGNSKALSAPSPEEVEKRIQEMVKERNQEVRRQMGMRGDPDKTQAIKGLADTLGMSL